MTIPHLEGFEISLVVTIITEVVSIMGAVAHHDIFMLFWHDQDAVGIKSQHGRFLFIVAAVTIEIGHIFLGLHQVGF